MRLLALKGFFQPRECAPTDRGNLPIAHGPLELVSIGVLLEGHGLAVAKAPEVGELGR
jgi:hypothetical protein